MQRLIVVDGGGASCSLSDEDVRVRLREWAALRDRADAVERVPGGVSLRLPDAEPIDDAVSLVARESECCPFYSFSIEVTGSSRRLMVSAGPTGEPAVHALLSLDPASIPAGVERR